MSFNHVFFYARLIIIQNEGITIYLNSGNDSREKVAKKKQGFPVHGCEKRAMDVNKTHLSPICFFSKKKWSTQTLVSTKQHFFGGTVKKKHLNAIVTAILVDRDIRLRKLLGLWPVRRECNKVYLTKYINKKTTMLEHKSTMSNLIRISFVEWVMKTHMKFRKLCVS